jgi:hypothetical protein
MKFIEPFEKKGWLWYKTPIIVWFVLSIFWATLLGIGIVIGLAILSIGGLIFGVCWGIAYFIILPILYSCIYKDGEGFSKIKEPYIKAKIWWDKAGVEPIKDNKTDIDNVSGECNIDV